MQRVLPDTVRGRDIEFHTFKGRQDAQVTSLLACLLNEMENGYPGGRLFGEHLASALVLLLLRKYAVFQNNLPRFNPLDRSDLRAAQDYIHANLSSALSLQEIASVACLSVSQFARLFKSATGQSPYEYVIFARIERAQRLLGNRDLSISQIAAEVGFYDPSHFLRHFKRQTGQTPQQWRQEKTGSRCTRAESTSLAPPSPQNGGNIP